MKALKEYEIPFVGLKEGMHDYRFTIDNRFFDRFEYSEIHEGEVFVDLRMERKTRMMMWWFPATAVLPTWNTPSNAISG